MSRAVAIVVLCAATYGALSSAWRYATTVPDLLADRALAQGLAGPTPAGDGIQFAVEDGAPVARFTALGGGGVPALQWRIPIPPGTDALRPTVELKAERMAPGAQSWQVGRVQVLSVGAEGRVLWYWPKHVASVSGNTDWLLFEDVIPTGADLGGMVLVIYNGADSGVMAARALRVAGLAERTAFTAIRWVLGVAWLALGIWCVRPMLRAAAHPTAKVMLVTFGGLALAGTLAPQPAFERAIVPLKATLADWLAPEPAPPQAISGGQTGPTVDAPTSTSAAIADRPASAPEGPLGIGFKEIGHFTAFALLTLAAFGAFPGVPVVIRVVHVLAFAVATETLQLFLVTRSARLTDLAFDAAGILTGVVAILLARGLMAGVRARSTRAASPGAGT